MRTTVSLADDVLQAARERARVERRTLGEVLSELARRGLARDGGTTETERNGFPVLPSRGRPVTNELIDALRDDEHL